MQQDCDLLRLLLLLLRHAASRRRGAENEPPAAVSCSRTAACLGCITRGYLLVVQAVQVAPRSERVRWMAHTTHRLSASRTPLGAPHRLPLGAHMLSPATPVAPRATKVWWCPVESVLASHVLPVMCLSVVARMALQHLAVRRGVPFPHVCVHVCWAEPARSPTQPGCSTGVLQGVDTCGTACVCVCLCGVGLCGPAQQSSGGFVECACLLPWAQLLPVGGNCRLPGVGRDAAHMHLRGARCLQHAWAPPCPAWFTG